MLIKLNAYGKEGNVEIPVKSREANRRIEHYTYDM